MESKKHTCCFFGHRKITVTQKLTDNLQEIIEKAIIEDKIDTFLFGSKSEFDRLCLKVVSNLKDKYPHIKRIYVRAEFPYIDEDYMSYILKSYDCTYYPERVVKAGRAAYVERNCEMINNSSCCIIYYDENYTPPKRKSSKKNLSGYQPNSGTKCAYDYAVRKGIRIVNVFEVK